MRSVCWQHSGLFRGRCHFGNEEKHKCEFRYSNLILIKGGKIMKKISQSISILIEV